MPLFDWNGPLILLGMLSGAFLCGLVVGVVLGLFVGAAYRRRRRPVPN